MQKFALEDQKTLQDITAMTIGKIGENMTLNRSLCLVAPKDHYLGRIVFVTRRYFMGRCIKRFALRSFLNLS